MDPLVDLGNRNLGEPITPVPAPARDRFGHKALASTSAPRMLAQDEKE